MSEPEWFRNADWNDEIAAAFEDRLRRARRKEQYLRIQASTLRKTHPEVAIVLLDRYFMLPEQSDAAQAHVDKAGALLALGRVDEAILAYESALSREEAFPKLLTQAYVELPYLVATHEIESQYPRALHLLGVHKGRIMFPVDSFKWNAARALIAKAVGEPSLPYEYAKLALEAASLEHSGFQNHPDAGLVTNALAEVKDRVRRLCSA